MSFYDMFIESFLNVSNHSHLHIPIISCGKKARALIYYYCGDNAPKTCVMPAKARVQKATNQELWARHG